MRLLDHLPAIYRQHDGELSALLAPFEALLFDGDAAPGGLPGIGRELDDLPSLFVPLGTDEDARRTPERFLHWLAAWLQFAPHGLVAPDRLRHVVAGIVPLYARRGTRDYLATLLRLCFDEVRTVEVTEHDGGLYLGRARIGQDSVLASERPFWFRVTVGLRSHMAPDSADAAIEPRLRAVIDFAKPAHTAYELSTTPCKQSN
jgi:phage tail-like protein